VIDRRRDAYRLGRSRGGGLAAWGVESEVGVACQFGGASACPFGQVALGQGLHPPSAKILAIAPSGS